MFFADDSLNICENLMLRLRNGVTSLNYVLIFLQFHFDSRYDANKLVMNIYRITPYLRIGRICFGVQFSILVHKHRLSDFRNIAISFFN